VDSVKLPNLKVSVCACAGAAAIPRSSRASVHRAARAEHGEAGFEQTESIARSVCNLNAGSAAGLNDVNSFTDINLVATSPLAVVVFCVRLKDKNDSLVARFGPSRFETA
jgi:hypothetical protein